jgi:hypothetical protein
MGFDGIRVEIVEELIQQKGSPFGGDIADRIGELIFLALVKLSRVRRIGLNGGFKPIFDDFAFVLFDKSFQTVSHKSSWGPGIGSKSAQNY